MNMTDSSFINSLKRVALVCNGNEVNYSKQDIETLIPHRDPFLLLDKITQIDLQEKMIEGIHVVDPGNPVLKGHFPGNPVYPGVFQIEMMGQMGLCLCYFETYQTTTIQENHQPIKGLFTKVHHTGFLERICPGDSLRIVVKLIGHDEFLGTIASQVIKSDQICSYSILEVYFEE